MGIILTRHRHHGWAEAYAHVYDVFRQVYGQISPIHKALRKR